MNWKFWQGSDEVDDNIEDSDSISSKKIAQKASEMDMHEAIQIIGLLETQIEIVMAKNELLEMKNSILRERLSLIDREGYFR